jgi:hypothetical protein
MPSFKTILFVGAAAVLAASSASAQDQAAQPSPIEKVLGRSPAVTGDVQRYAFPRSDLSVTVDGVRIKPALALGGWLAFRPMGGADHWEVMGDLVLTQDEVKPVMQKLIAGGLTVTALHNHLLRAEPFTMYMHVEGHGDPTALATTLEGALAETKTPLGAPPAAAAPPALDSEFDRATIEKIMGRSGTVAGGGVLQFSIPRAQPIQEDGKPIPGPFGVSTAINFQPAGEGRVASTGDFVLAADEVEPVVATLTKAGIEITALHSHMVHEEPRTFFMHFWSLGPADKVAAGLKAAVDQTKSQAPAK